MSEQLTPREQEVIELICLGYTRTQIASQLRISLGTVKYHLQYIMRRLDAVNITQAAVLWTKQTLQPQP